MARRFWRALGFLDVGDDEAVFTEMDIEAVRLFQSMVAMGLVDVDTAVQMARVIGTSMARIAEAETPRGSTPILISSGDSIIDADEFARRAGTSIPAMSRLLEYVWRRHLQAATRRAMLARIRGIDEGISPTMAVGFADMVGFTLLSQHLSQEELAAVVSRFEELAHDTVVALGGRVVKMIGDEAMFVVQTATMAAEIGLSLSEAYAGDELLSDVRVGLAIGPVLVQDGDYYGPVVNLASRLVGVANPGTVLVSGEFRAALGADEGRRVRDHGAQAPDAQGHGPGPALEAVTGRERTGSRPAQERPLGAPRRGPPRTRGAPGPRGAGRARGVASGGVGVRTASDPVEPDGGDAVAPEVELPFEGGERIVPVGRPASPTGRGTRPRRRPSAG